jgi:hypothetical protein
VWSVPCAISACRALCASICLLSSFWPSINVKLRIKWHTSALGDSLSKVIAFLQDSLPLTLCPFIKSKSKSIHFHFQIIESEIDRCKGSYRDGRSFCHVDIVDSDGDDDWGSVCLLSARDELYFNCD